MTRSLHERSAVNVGPHVSSTVAVENVSTEPCDEVTLGALASFTIARLGLHPQDELSVRIVDEAEMAELHVTWMDEPGATDVLSFPMDELRPMVASVDRQPGLLGDIVLCPAFARRQALDEGKTADALSDILAMLLVHGILHLIGHDHATQNEYDTMFATQDDILEAWRAAGHRVVTS